MSVYANMKESGIDWIGAVPSHWAMHTLYQLVSPVKAKNKDLREKNLLSLSYGKIKRKNIEDTEGLLPESFDGYNIIEAGDVVLRLTDLQNDHTSLRVGLATERGIITSAYTTLRPSENCVSKYLYYLLHSFDIRKGFYGMGSGVRQGLNYDEVKKLRIVLPRYDEQVAIVAYLDEQCALIDGAIIEARSSIDEYKAWKASIIFETVTKGLNRNVEMKDSDVAWIGQIPRHWNCVKSKRVILSTQNGITRRDLEKSEGQIVLKLKNITADGEIDYNEPNRIELTEAEKLSYRLMPRDLLFVRVNGSRNLVGKCALFDGNIELVAYNDHIIRTRITDTYSAQYFRYYLLSHAGKVEIELHTITSAGQYTISGDGLRDLNITYPPMVEQTSIVEYLDAKCKELDSLIAKRESLITNLDAYRKSLIYEAVTGKRKVVQ